VPVLLNLFVLNATQSSNILGSGSNADLDAIWCYGLSAIAKAPSIGNLKQAWTNEGLQIDLLQTAQAEGRWCLEHAHLVKNIWVP
jgi:hypothetical protein